MGRKIRLAAATLAWLAASLLPLHAQFNTESFQGTQVAAGEALVKFRAGGQPSPALRKAEDLVLVQPVGGDGAYLLRSGSKSAARLVSSLLQRSDVLYAEPNSVLHIQTIPNDPMFGYQWPLWNTGQEVLGLTGIPGADLGTFNAWDFVTGNRDQVVAVLDTGVDLSHPDLVNNLWSSANAFDVQMGGRSILCPAGTHGFNFVKRNCDPSDDNQHGTLLAGIIGAEGNNAIGVSGVNWAASVMAVKALDSKGGGTVSTVVDAIEFVIQAKATGLANVRVITTSWGTSVYSKALMDAVERAYRNDILFVAAAGNQASNNDLSPFYPASFSLPNVISVAATGNQDTLYSQSNYGATSVHLGAPGAFLLSTIPGDYGYGAGSSLAAAHVAGAAALVLSLCPELGTADLREMLLVNVQSLASLNGLVSTHGRLSAEHALGACDRPGFQLSALANSASAARGEDAIFTIHVEPTKGYVGEIPLQVEGLPAGATAAFSPAIVSTPGDSTLTITVDDSVGVGTYLLTVRATDIGGTSRSTPLWLEVMRRRR